MPNKYKKVTEPGRIIPSILANISAGIEAGKKPLDALFDDTDKVVDKFYKDIDKIGFKGRKKSLDPYIKTLIDKIEGLESELGELKTICTKDQLARLAYVMKRKREDSEEINNEIAKERGNEVECNNSHEDFGIDEHEEELIEKRGV